VKARALITGVTGQDGWYLRELLEDKGYEVYGWRRDECNVTDPEQVRVAVQQAQPNEIYHLAAQSHVGDSEGAAQETRRVNVQGTENLLRSSQREVPEARFFFASSCHVFGDTTETPQKETTPFQPVNPYGASKLEATLRVRAARQAGLFAVNGFLYNHESPRRGENFVTQKICRGAASIAAGQSQELRLGYTSMRRDWSDARDIVRGMWLSLQVEQPDDYILASGEAHTVQEVVEIAFETAGLDWKKHVVCDQQFNRSADPACLVGDPSKARAVLDWEPKKGFRELIVEMTQSAQRVLT
jgi:GDPmannose 4,6-dehydratase